MVYLKMAILSQDPPVFQMPQDPREVGEEQREYELSLWLNRPLASAWIRQHFMSLSSDSPSDNSPS